MFHGALEEFDSVYYYEGPPQFGSGNVDNFVDQLVAAERKVYSEAVKFKAGRVWTAGGTIRENITLGLVDKTGTGTMPAGARLHAEAAVLVEWECARPNILGRKVYLRKYIRSQYLPLGATDDSAMAISALNSSAKAPYKTYANDVQVISVASLGAFELVSPTGRKPKEAQNGVVDQYLRTREFRRN
jgi:hypothetical protein